MHGNNSAAESFNLSTVMYIPNVALRKVVQPPEKLRLPEITVSPMPSPTSMMLVFFFLTSMFLW